MYKADGGVGTAYQPISLNEAVTLSERLAAQQRSANLWFVSAHEQGQGGDGESLSGQSNLLFQSVDQALNQFNENIYEWLDDRGFEFASDTRAGFGDLDIDVFYEHRMADDVIAEFFAGVRIPTGINDNYCENPYRPHLGNGEHFEIKAGGMLAWEPCGWMNVKADGRFAFVLKATEKRPAAFCGAQIKNIGPCVRADVSWQYLVGTVDFNLFHPKTNAISTVLGYEFYYKTKDDIDFHCRCVESWLGQKFDPDTLTWDANAQTLDSSVAEKNSEGIAHKVRLETSFRITQYFEIFCGGTYTFAGRNVPRESDAHGGFVVTF